MPVKSGSLGTPQYDASSEAQERVSICHQPILAVLFFLLDCNFSCCLVSTTQLMCIQVVMLAKKKMVKREHHECFATDSAREWRMMCTPPHRVLILPEQWLNTRMLLPLVLVSGCRSVLRRGRSSTKNLKRRSMQRSLNKRRQNLKGRKTTQRRGSPCLRSAPATCGSSSPTWPTVPTLRSLHGRRPPSTGYE
ncbi:uncharacterized protein LOC127757141 [Oryza glaberrima]|uniref:uncharacterized protein LOC127757141 n=1 Tax=Oryza glaberrima TaxID=4538 RepID=UPI00224BF100|nr:uncharacterized protein LOC127757141 [Oryza glaberrima]